ncbi:hypothetical protein M3I53_20165 [Paraburkholderia sp. CNPSo 3272]|uniref:hypothetical protein n=1 Tax=Paraburkholderia sp. CNPSo 3272 TaxID=2940931 RepID=UPI0020B63E45|nr:hypothetical protein [Paraburkholderia sp. CNPSo 3272]MCP3725409.1 hypothetical protein [Paraburkholderia sp. CNPSo 3272]
MMKRIQGRRDMAGNRNWLWGTPMDPHDLFDSHISAAEAQDVKNTDSVVEAIEAEVRFLLHRRASTGESTSIASLLGALGPRPVGYWIEAAKELHAQGEHYDALDCWKQAAACDCKADLNEMGDALWSASGFGEDEFLAQEAEEAFKSVGEWSAVAKIRQVLGREVGSVLDAVGEALVADGKLDSDWTLDAIRCADRSSIYVDSWETLADAYMQLNERAKAFSTWANALRSDPHDSNDRILRSAIVVLVDVARLSGYKDEDLFP